MIYCSIAFWKTMVVADSVILHTTSLLPTLTPREGIVRELVFLKNLWGQGTEEE
jgi:hypothetical protein